jgi:hypothetical protein
LSKKNGVFMSAGVRKDVFPYPAVTAAAGVAQAGAVIMAPAAYASVTRRFIPRTIIIQREKVHFCAVRTFPNEASVLHAVEGDPKEKVLFVLNARSLFVERFQKKIAGNDQTQRIFDALVKNYTNHYRKDGSDAVLQRNATYIFQQFSRVAAAVASKKKQTLSQPEAYSKACLKRGYCFTRLDFPLIADILERHLCVYSSLGNLEVEYGNQYKHEIVLVEHEHQLETAQVHPIYTRYEPQTYFDVPQRMWYDSFTVPEIQIPLNLYRDFTISFNRGQVPIHIFQNVFDYTGIPFESYVNEGLQAVLHSEGWNTIVQSPQNWSFVQPLYRRVTHLCCPSGNFELIQRVKSIACPSLFPCLRSIQFSAQSIVENCIDVLNQNPQCHSVMFEEISVQSLNAIFTRLPEFTSQLTALTVSLRQSAPKKKPAATGSAEVADVTLPQALKPLAALQGLSLKLDRQQLLDQAAQEALLSMTKLDYLDLNGLRVPIVFIKTYINKAQERLSLSAIDVSWHSQRACQPVKRFPGVLTIKNCISNSDGTLLPFLYTDRSLSKLDVSGINFSYEELSTLSKPPQTLKYLNLEGCYTGEQSLLQIIANLAQLEYLDLTGCKILLEHVPLLANLKNLRVLKAGGFIAYTRGSGDGSYTLTDSKLVSNFVMAFKQALPNVEVDFKSVTYIQRYTEKELRMRP